MLEVLIDLSLAKDINELIGGAEVVLESYVTVTSPPGLIDIILPSIIVSVTLELLKPPEGTLV